MAKKKSNGKETKSKEARNTSRTAKPIGRSPIWTQLLGEDFRFCCSVIGRHLRDVVTLEVEEPPGNNPTRIIPYVRALVCLLRAHPYWPRHFSFYKEDVAK